MAGYTEFDNDQGPHDLSKEAVRQAQKRQMGGAQPSPQPAAQPMTAADKAMAILRQILPSKVNAKARKQDMDDTINQQTQ